MEILIFLGLIYLALFIWSAIGLVLLIKFSGDHSEQIAQDFLESARGGLEGRNKVRISLIAWPYHLYKILKYKKLNS
jgi:hypothetical protein